jgi:hypothetical protein
VSTVRITGLVLLCAGGLAAASAVAQPPLGEPGRPTAPADVRPATPREGLSALEQHLDDAVDRVSLPRPIALSGRGGSRGYRLPGYGIVLVLTPRTIPGEDATMDVLRPRPRFEIRRVRPRSSGEPRQELDHLERQVIVLQHETERARRAAEEDMERIVQELRVRVSPDGTHIETHLQARTGAEPAPAQPRRPPPDAGEVDGCGASSAAAAIRGAVRARRGGGAAATGGPAAGRGSAPTAPATLEVLVRECGPA